MRLPACWIDFIPLSGDGLDRHVRDFGQWALENTTEPERGEIPGALKTISLSFSGAEVDGPAWRGVGWSDELDAREALDQWTDQMMREHPDLAYLVVLRTQHEKPEPSESTTSNRWRKRWEGGNARPDLAAIVWMHWPGSTQGVEGHLIPFKDWANEGAPLQDSGRARLLDSIEKAVDGSPGFQKYLQALNLSQKMDDDLPQASANKQPGIRM